MDNRTYLVTGASKGIGLAIAKSLARDGIQVILLARQSEKLEAACEQVKSISSSSFSIACDLASYESIDSTIQSLQRIISLFNFFYE